MCTLVLLLFLLLLLLLCQCVSHTRDPLTLWNAFVNVKHVPGDPQSAQLANATTCIVIEFCKGGSVPPQSKDRSL